MNPFRYRGYIFDEETGLYYLRSRYYNPNLCRFINADDVEALGADGDINGYQLFIYCMNDPVNNRDEAGSWSLPNWAKVAIGAALIVGAAVVATVATGGVACFAAGAAIGAAKGAVSGAIGGAVTGAIQSRIETGSWDGALEAAVDGAADGFLGGAIGGFINSQSCIQTQYESYVFSGEPCSKKSLCLIAFLEGARGNHSLAPKNGSLVIFPHTYSLVFFLHQTFLPGITWLVKEGTDMEVWIGMLIPFAGTALGAACVIFMGAGVLNARTQGALAAFAGGTASGAVEPLAAGVTLLLSGLIAPVLPALLTFAAGAMIYVTVAELIPRAAQTHPAFFVLGFSLMMGLDVALG